MTQKNFRKKLRNNPTPQEVVLWSRLRRKQLGYKFRRQHSFDRYVVDFYCRELQLVIELDGWQHKDEFSGNKEIERTKYLENKELYILRFWNNEINNNIDNVVQRIVDTCSKLNDK
jgi:very-short-patch-repair endonuclease